MEDFESVLQEMPMGMAMNDGVYVIERRATTTRNLGDEGSVVGEEDVSYFATESYGDRYHAIFVDGIEHATPFFGIEHARHGMKAIGMRETEHQVWDVIGHGSNEPEGGTRVGGYVVDASYTPIRVGDYYSC